MRRYKLPRYTHKMESKRKALVYFGSEKKLFKKTNITKELWNSWEQDIIPPPYSYRIRLSKYGKYFADQARYVSIKDALIIFKKERALKRFFKIKTLRKRFLNEDASAFMLEYFSEFMVEYKQQDIESRFICS